MEKSWIAGSSLMVLLGLGCPGVMAGHHGGQPKQAMFKTKAEAEAAAPGFGCEGAHQMGTMWMVCTEHSEAGHSKAD